MHKMGKRGKRYWSTFFKVVSSSLNNGTNKAFSAADINISVHALSNSIVVGFVIISSNHSKIIISRY